jgi:hypothetical protein
VFSALCAFKSHDQYAPTSTTAEAELHLHRRTGLVVEIEEDLAVEHELSALAETLFQVTLRLVALSSEKYPIEDEVILPANNEGGDGKVLTAADKRLVRRGVTLHKLQQLIRSPRYMTVIEFIDDLRLLVGSVIAFVTFICVLICGDP